MPRVRQDGREAWRRRHGNGSVGAVDSHRPSGSATRSGGRARPASAASLREDAAAVAAREPPRTNQRQRSLPDQRPPATSRDARVARRAAARERKAAVRTAQQAAIQRRAEELAAARASAEDNSALDALINEVQEKLYQKRGDIARGFIDLFDKNRDGSVDLREITAAIEELLNKKVQPELMAGIVARTDTDGNGSIDLNEFIAVLKINDKQTRDVIRNATSSAPSARHVHRHSPIDTKALTPPARVERSTQDWLTKRQQELGDAGGIAQIVRRSMLDGGGVREAVTPPAGSPRKPVGLWEIQAKEEQRQLAEKQAEIDRIEKGGEHERALREIAAVKQSRANARVRIARANRQADADRSARVKEKAEKYDVARIAAKRFQREEWEAQAGVRDFYSCGFHGAQRVEPDAHPSEVRRKAPSQTPVVAKQFLGGQRSAQNPFWSARADNPEVGPSAYVGVVGGRPATPAKPVTYAWS